MPLTNWWLTLNTLSRLALITARHCSGAIFLNDASRVMPALLTMTSICPQWEMTCAVADSTAAGLVTSMRWNRAWPLPTPHRPMQAFL